jgi:hypothetical protein
VLGESCAMRSDPLLDYRANIRGTQIRVESMVGDIPWPIDRNE